MKKVAALVTSLLLVGMSVMMNAEEPKVRFGKGDGKNAAVETVEEAGKVLTTFVNSFNGSQTLARVASASLSEENEINEEIGNEYTSVTVSFSTIASVSIDFEQNFDYSMRMDREMTCYYTKEAAYYDVSFMIINQQNYHTENLGEDNASVLSLKGEVYLDIVKESSFMKISRFVYTDKNSKSKDGSEILNKWIDITDLDNSLLDSNETNYEIMELIGEWMSKTELFDEIGNVYSLKDDEGLAFYLALFSITAGNVSVKEKAFTDYYFDVDMTQKQAPIMTLFYDLKEEQDVTVGGTLESPIKNKCTTKSTEKLVCKLQNINNTVVEFSDDLKVYDYTEIEEMFA